jgi:hypothetical protein
LSEDRRDFSKLIAVVQQRAELDSTNPEAHYIVAIHYWDEARRSAHLTRSHQREYVKNGLAAIDRAIALNPRYIDALVCRGLLLRMEAGGEGDAERQKSLLDQAAEMQHTAVSIKKEGK